MKISLLFLEAVFSILLIIVLSCSGCKRSEGYSFEDKELSLEHLLLCRTTNNPSKLNIAIQGTIDCEYAVEFIERNNSVDIPQEIHFYPGVIDTLISTDWYEQVVGLRYSPKGNCTDGKLHIVLSLM